MSADDRLAIQDLLAHYAHVVDSRDFDRLDEVFTPEARIDFGAFGGPAGGLAETKEFLNASLPMFRRSQHMMGLPLVTLDGDRATVRTPCHNPMVIDNADGSTSVWLIGLWYDDTCVRTPDGWRISDRRQERCYFVTSLTDAPS
jgi:hypothetical protein